MFLFQDEIVDENTIAPPPSPLKKRCNSWKSDNYIGSNIEKNPCEK